MTPSRHDRFALIPRCTSPILDRRTIVTLLTNLGLFVLAFHEEPV
jgi:hypothetical protein